MYQKLKRKHPEAKISFRQVATSPVAPPAAPPAEEARPAYSTYAEYYARAWKETVRPDQRLIRAEFTGVRHMMPHLKRKVKESDAVLLVPELCLCFPLPYTAFFLPSLCIRVERQLLLMELKQQIEIISCREGRVSRRPSAS